MILITGGLGFIGSHMGAVLGQAGLPFLLLDNLINATQRVLPRLQRILGHAPPFVDCDVTDKAALTRVFETHPITAVMHFAALKSAPDSVRAPLDYYANNVGGLITLLEVMRAADVPTLVFSSSATVYGDMTLVPIREEAPLHPFTPYGQTKLMAERMLTDIAAADLRWRIAVLRYFNPVGVHESGLIGEDPLGVPGNLMPLICQVAAGRRDRLLIYGKDYPTRDGTGMRDFIHVMDLAEGHLAALSFLKAHVGVHVFNLGTGQGVCVLEMLRAFEEASGRAIPFTLAPRRAGDIAISVADVTKAATWLGWRARRGLKDMCNDAWRWQTLNPQGYATPNVPAL